MGWEWLTPPDEYGYGAFNVGWQDVPALGGKLEAAFASWDNPEPYIAFPLEHEYAMLMRFWRYDPAQQQFKLAGMGILLEWEEAPGGGTNTWTKILALNGKGCSSFVDADHSAMLHEREEIGSWTMSDLEMAWRKDFDMSSYESKWKVSESKKRVSGSDLDPGNIKIFSKDELQKMDIEGLQNAYEALWQKYLGVKMSADYALHYFAVDPQSGRKDCSEIYNKNFMPKE